MSSAEFEAYQARRNVPVRQLNGVTVMVREDLVNRESDLHSQIFNECRRRGWIAFHGSMSERTHRTLGEPDFTILADLGRVLMVECKAKGGKLSPEQQAMIRHAEKLGHKIYVVWSFQEFLKLL